MPWPKNGLHIKAGSLAGETAVRCWVRAAASACIQANTVPHTAACNLAPFFLPLPPCARTQAARSHRRGRGHPPLPSSSSSRLKASALGAQLWLQQLHPAAGGSRGAMGITAHPGMHAPAGNTVGRHRSGSSRQTGGPKAYFTVCSSLHPNIGSQCQRRRTCAGHRTRCPRTRGSHLAGR